MTFPHALHQRLLGLPRAGLALGVAVGLLVTGLLDYWTGLELSFSIFYLGPVLVAAAYGGRCIGTWAALGAGAVWLLSDILSGHEYTRAWIPYWNASVRLAFFLLTAWLLGELLRRLREEASRSLLDALTGALNGRGFSERLLAEIARAERYAQRFTLAYVDLDNFKSVNDRGGHAEGDRVLRVIVDLLRGRLRRTDSFGRMGGDEFAVLLPETGEREATAVLEGLAAAVRTAMRRQGLGVTLSVGAVVYESSPGDLATAVRLADELMYQAKRGGKDRVLVEVWRG